MNDARPPLVVCDLDGVVWLAGRAIDGAPAALTALRRAGLRLLFLTNNSSATVDDVVGALAAAGVEAEPPEVLTSALVTAELVSSELGAGARVLTCAGPGVVAALEEVDVEPVDAWPCDAVVVGWHRSFDYDALARASDAVRRGARFLATNEDPTYPAPEGLIPGNGALVAAVATAAGVSPDVAGKPHAPTVAAVTARAAGATGVVVGDRPSTDGLLARKLDWPFVLVRSAVSVDEGSAVSGGADAEGESLALLVADVVRLARD